MKVSEGSTYQNPPPGTHVARCISIVDLGTQPIQWQGTTKYSRKVRFAWELSDSKMDDGRPFSTSRRYTQSLHIKSGLRHDLESWRGKKFSKEELSGFDLKVCLGHPCLLNLVEDGEYVNVQSISPVPKGMKVPKQINPSVFFSLDPAEFDVRVFGSLSDKTKETISHSPEYAALVKPDHQADAGPIDDADVPTAGPEEDDIPF